MVYVVSEIANPVMATGLRAGEEMGGAPPKSVIGNHRGAFHSALFSSPATRVPITSVS